MKTYQSKTGYVKCVDGTCYEAKTIYLGKYDNTTKAENDLYLITDDVSLN